MIKKSYFLHYNIILISFIVFFISSVKTSFGADEENCILCHRHKGLKIITENFEIKDLSIDFESYKNSIHKKSSCRGCHINITEIPHKKEYKKVNCGQVCHLKADIFTSTFTHAKLYDAFMTSAHGTEKEDNPDCLYCHPLNRSKDTPPKSKIEIMAECSKCHIDKEMMDKYEISSTVVQSHQNTIHNKIFFLEQKSGVMCTDCHSVHSILPKKEETSPINEKNLYKTCAGQEAKSTGCHLASNPNFIFSFNHEKDKEAGFATALKLESIVGYLTLFVFYFFCILNILRIIRE